MRYLASTQSLEGLLERLDAIAAVEDADVRRTRAAALLLRAPDAIFEDAREHCIVLGLLTAVTLKRIAVVRAEDMAEDAWRFHAFALLERDFDLKVAAQQWDGDEEDGTVFREE